MDDIWMMACMYMYMYIYTPLPAVNYVTLKIYLVSMNIYRYECDYDDS